jgi:cell division inhibitor SulA
MGAVVALSSLLDARQVWRGQAQPITEGEQPTGWPQLDAVLPTRGWPEAALSEILLPADGIGELRLVLPTLARLTQGARPVVLIAPPYLPCAMGWRQQGVNLQRLDIVDAEEKHVLWAAEQCLRSGSCAAVLAWPREADDRSLRRLQVAADTGRALAFVFRDRKHLAHASPASLRLELAASPRNAIWVRKCRGGNAPSQPVSFDQFQGFSGSRGEGTGTCPIFSSEEGRNPAASPMAHQRGSCLPDSGLHYRHARKKPSA